jgi:hypothetical protein
LEVGELLSLTANSSAFSRSRTVADVQNIGGATSFPRGTLLRQSARPPGVLATAIGAANGDPRVWIRLRPFLSVSMSVEKLRSVIGHRSIS